MGGHLSAVTSKQLVVTESTHPSKNDWITKHATVTGLAIVEIERLWLRFQQLGCNEDGNLTAEIFTRPPASQDIFVKNILTTFKGPNTIISFQVFVNAMKWAETTTVEKKISGVFYLLNNGNNVSKDTLFKVMRRTYPDDAESNVQRITDVFMEQMDTNKQGFVTEEQFVQWVMSMPQDQVESILEFYIIPQDINEEAQKQFSQIPSRELTFENVVKGRGTDNDSESPVSQYNPMEAGPSISRQIPTDSILKEISNKIYKRDWHLLANKLGFTGTDISAMTVRYGSKKEQCYEMLKAWREREGSNAYAEVLETALRESKMNDAALILYP